MNEAQDTRLAARATLFAVRAILSFQQRALQESYVISPDSILVASDDAEVELTRLRKPLSCDAVVDDLSIRVECVPLDGLLLEGWKHWIDNGLERRMKYVAKEFGSSANAPVILLKGGGKTMLLEFEQYRRWRRDYRIILPHAMTLDRADSEAKSRGAAALLRFSAAGVVSVHKRSG